MASKLISESTIPMRSAEDVWGVAMGGSALANRALEALLNSGDNAKIDDIVSKAVSDLPSSLSEQSTVDREATLGTAETVIHSIVHTARLAWQRRMSSKPD